MQSSVVQACSQVQPLRLVPDVALSELAEPEYGSETEVAAEANFEAGACTLAELAPAEVYCWLC